MLFPCCKIVRCCEFGADANAKDISGKTTLHRTGTSRVLADANEAKSLFSIAAYCASVYTFSIWRRGKKLEKEIK